MKKNKIIIIILIALYLILCKGYMVYSKSDEVKKIANNSFQNYSKLNEYNILKTISEYGYDIYYSDDRSSATTLIMYQVLNDYFMNSGYDNYPEYKMIFTDIKNYKKDLADNGIIDFAKLDVIEDYQTDMPIFDEAEKYDSFVRTIVKDVSKVTENPDDLMVVIAQGDSVIDNFYIDGRIVDYSDMLHSVNKIDFYNFRYSIDVVKNTNDTNPRLTLLSPEKNKWEEIIYYDKDNEECVHTTRIIAEDGNIKSEEMWTEPMSMEDFEDSWGDVENRYIMRDGEKMVTEKIK